MTAVRTCVACREEGDRDEMFRFVAAPDETPAVDLKANLPGRGVWVHASASCLTGLGSPRCPVRRALGLPSSSGVGLLQELRSLLERRVLESLSVARKAGGIVLGFDAVLLAAKAGRLRAVVFAQDVAERTRAAAEEAAAPLGLELLVAPVGKDDLGKLLGRESVAVVGLSVDPTGRHALAQLRRLARVG